MGLSTTGIIAGGMAGLGGAVVDIAKTGIEADNRMLLLKATKEAEIDKAAAIEEMRSAMGRRARTEMSTDINTRTDNILGQQQADRLNADRSGTIAGPAVKPEEMSDYEKGAYPVTDAQRTTARARAASEGGWVSPSDELVANTRLGTAAEATQRMGDRIDSNERIARERIESNERNVDAKIDAAIAKAGAKTSPHDKLTTIVNSANQTIKSLTESDRPKTPEGKAEWERQLSDAKALRDRAMQRLRTGMNDESPDGYSGSSSSPKPSSGSGRKDVSEALKIWNSGR